MKFDPAKECEDARGKAVLPPQPYTVEKNPASKLDFRCLATDATRLKLN